MTTQIRKTLSANDLGKTGGHMAGILVPKATEVLSFFPALDGSTKNPRISLVMYEGAHRTRWEFNFIYYNNRLFGGTRNEYRLTCMTAYLRAIDAKVGDDLAFRKDENHSYEIDIVRANRPGRLRMDGDILVLSGGWTIIPTR